MPADYLPGKIASPRLPSTILHRERLITLLNTAIGCEGHGQVDVPSYKLVLLCTPAGYGKTTLLADFAHTTPLSCCWYFLDHTDTDYVLFLSTLLASLRRTFPGFGKRLDTFFASLFARGAVSPKAIYQTAIDKLCHTIADEIVPHFAILLCNYEEINESALLNDLMSYFLKKLPTGVTLVIESRTLPKLECASLLVHDQMVVLNNNALRFSVDEISGLAQLQGLASFTQAEAEHLSSSFDGWITGILLGTRLGSLRFLSLSQNTPANQDFISLEEKSTAALKRKNLFSYLVNEVFQRNTMVYNFLQAACILQQMDGEMCDALLETNDAEEHLSYLEQQGLFVHSYESDEQTFYICHPVIRNLLSKQLAQQAPKRFVALHERAARLWKARQNYEQAIHHALKADAQSLVAQLILLVYRQLLQQGQSDTLTRWLQSLSGATRERFPRLLLIEAAVALMNGQHTTALALLDKALALLLAVPESEEMAHLQDELNVLRSKALFQAGDYSQVQSLCLQILARHPEPEAEIRAAAEMRLGICLSLQGDFTAGITHLQYALQDRGEPLPPGQARDIHGALANTYSMVGNFALAEHHLAHALEYCERMHDEQGRIDNLARKGILYMNQGLYAEAEEALLAALTQARATRAQRGTAYALANLGSLYLEQGQYARALSFCEDGLALARHWGNYSLLNITLSNIATIHLLMGDPTSALLFIEKRVEQVTDAKTVTYEQAWGELTYGLILFSQKRYAEAHTVLARIDALLRNTDLKREQVQSKLRLAACELAQENQVAATQLLEELHVFLVEQKHYRPLALRELQWLPELFQMLRALPELSAWRDVLDLANVTPAVGPIVSCEPAMFSQGHPSELTIRAFGEPVVLIDAQPITHWRMARAMELFFFLLDASYPVSKEQIITDIWSEVDEQTNQTFHSTIYYLRKVFGTDCLIFQSGGYSLDLAARYAENVWYDVREFQARRAQADAALGQEGYDEARSALLKMVEMYQGDYGRPFYSDWCMFRRDELRTTYLEARRRLAQIAWQNEDFGESTEHWRSMLGIDSCLEEAHLGIMRCYIRQGKRSAALRQYRHCQGKLLEDLGVQPGPALQKLYQRLLAASEMPVLPAKKGGC